MTPVSLDDLMPKSQLMIRKVEIEPKKEEVSPCNELINAFSTSLQKHLNKVNDSLSESDKLTRMLAAGEIENVHTVMIAAEKANIAMNFTMAMRDRIIRAYEDTLAMGGR